MAETLNSIPPRLAEIVEDFQWSEGREKLELLLQHAEEFPPVPEGLRDHDDTPDRVEECMTPVYVAADMQAGKMVFSINVPESSPTVRGFASILLKGLQGLAPEEILSVPIDFYQEMGLEKVLTYQRMNGISAILAHMKSLALKEISRS